MEKRIKARMCEVSGNIPYVPEDSKKVTFEEYMAILGFEEHDLPISLFSNAS